MKTISFTLLLLITITLEAHVRKNEEWHRSTIYIGADDTLVSVQLNDNPVDLSEYGNYMDKFAIIKKASLVLFPGDELVFYVKNNKEVSKKDPAALGVRIEYVDQEVILKLCFLLPINGLVMVIHLLLMEVWLLIYIIFCGELMV